MKTIGMLLMLCFVFCVSGADAQKRKVRKSNRNQKKVIITRSVTRSAPTICEGGIVNKLAISLPPPEYPQAAKVAGASGSVVIRVSINEQGDVIEAAACAGNRLLRDSAVEAAKRAKFKPTVGSGKLVKLAGIIMYNFVLPK